MNSRLLKYFQLTKPSIMLLVLITGAASLVMEKSLLRSPGLLVLIMTGLMLTGGSANAFNMYFERDVDSRMTRTSKRRPLPLGLIEPVNALIFAIGIGAAGVSIFWIFFNLLSALLALGTILFYAFFYTLYLKPRTRYNIVIGGAAGSMAPVIAWAAASGTIALTPLILFMIIFLWTPPHFWALALYMKNDYELVGYPMMPVAAGDRATKRQILLYTIALNLFSALLYSAGAGLLYAVTALAAGMIFIYKSAAVYMIESNQPARGLFGYSIIYLFIVFLGIVGDAALRAAF